jgi:hypothetical protein
MKKVRLNAAVVILLMLLCSLFPMTQSSGETASRADADEEPNDDMASASEVTGNVTIQGEMVGDVGTDGSCTDAGDDCADNYKIQLAKGGTNADFLNVTVKFDQTGPLVSVRIYDEFGFLQAFLRDSKNTTLFHVADRPSAWYYVNITDDMMTHYTYNITFKIESVAFQGDGNNIPDDYVDVSSYPWDTATSADGDSEPHDHQDFYRVVLDITSNQADLLTVHMTQDATAQFNVEIFSKSGVNYVNTDEYPHEDPSNAGENQTKSFGASVPGEYFVRVWAANGSGNYHIYFNKIPIDINDNNNDIGNATHCGNATPIALTNHHYASFSGNVGETIDLEDFYCLDVSVGQFVNVTLTSDDYDPGSKLPKMHITYLDHNGIPWDVDPNMTDGKMDPTGYTNASAPEDAKNFIKVFVDNLGGGGGAYDADLVTDKKPVVVDPPENFDINISENGYDDSIKLAQMFADPDPPDTLEFSFEATDTWGTGFTDASNVSIVIGNDADRTLTITPRAGGVGEVGWTGSGTLAVAATDDFGLNETVSFTVRVKGANHRPFVKSPYNETGFIEPVTLIYDQVDYFEVDLSKGVIFDDIDLGDALQFDIATPDGLNMTKDTQTIQGKIVLKGATIDADFDGTMTPAARIAFDLNPNLIDHKGTITVRLTDEAKAAKAPFSIVVRFNATDDGNPPMTSSTVDMYINATLGNGSPPKWNQNFQKIVFNEDEKKNVNFDLFTSDVDPADKNALEFTISNLGDNVTVTKIERNIFEFSAPANWSGTVKEVELNATDTFGNFKNHTVDVEVKAVDDGPDKTGTTPDEGTTSTIDEGDSIELIIDVVDSDSASSALDFNWSLDGKWLRTAVTNTYIYEPDHDAAGNHTITVIVRDDNDPELSVNASWTIIVTDVPRPPTNVGIISPEEDDTYKKGDKITFQGRTAIDPDGDQLSYRWYVDNTEVPGGSGQMIIVDNLEVGDHAVKLVVSDGINSVDATVNITIEKKAVTDGEVGDMLPFFIVILVIIVIVAIAAAMSRKPSKPRPPERIEEEEEEERAEEREEEEEKEEKEEE